MKLFRSSEPLTCGQGHHWDPLRDWPLPAEGQRLVCPRCRGILHATVLRQRVVIEQQREKRQGRAILLVILPLFPAMVLLTWLSVSRWGVAELVVAPDGDTLAIARTTIDGGARIQVWDLAVDQEIARIGGEGQRIFGGGGDVIRSPAFLLDGKKLLVTKREVEAQPRSGEKGLRSIGLVLSWDYRGDRPPSTLRKNPRTIRALAVDRAGTTLLVVSSDRTVHVCDLATGKEQKSSTHAGEIQCLALTPDGRTLATGTAGGQISLWDLREGQARKTIAAHRSVVKGMAFDPTGQVLASVGGLDRTLRLWDVAAGTEAAAHVLDFDWLTCVAFAPDGQYLAVGGGSFQDQGQVQLWDLGNGRPKAVYRVNTNTVACLAFARDGKMLLAGSGHATSITGWHRQGRLHRWDLESGEEGSTLP